MKCNLENKPENAWASYCWLRRMRRIESFLAFIAKILLIALAFVLGLYMGM